jgi:hypothetical protein
MSVAVCAGPLDFESAEKCTIKCFPTYIMHKKIKSAVQYPDLNAFDTKIRHKFNFACECGNCQFKTTLKNIWVISCDDTRSYIVHPDAVPEFEEFVKHGSTTTAARQMDALIKNLGELVEDLRYNPIVGGFSAKKAKKQFEERINTL